jgi:hypothetical protein
MHLLVNASNGLFSPGEGANPCCVRSRPRSSRQLRIDITLLYRTGLNYVLYSICGRNEEALVAPFRRVRVIVRSPRRFGPTSSFSFRSSPLVVLLSSICRPHAIGSLEQAPRARTGPDRRLFDRRGACFLVLHSDLSAGCFLQRGQISGANVDYRLVPTHRTPVRSSPR